jgi:hypothetical protein
VLTKEVTLRVQHGLGLARGAARERDQARLVRAELRRARRLAREQRLVGDERDLAARLGRLQLCAVALVGHDQRRARDVDAQSQVFGAQLLGTRQHHRADAHARAHRQYPLRTIADQRHHHVTPLHAAPVQRARQSRAAIGDLAERPLTPRAVAGELHQRAVSRRQSIEHVAREVHGRSSASGA